MKCYSRASGEFQVKNNQTPNRTGRGTKAAPAADVRTDHNDRDCSPIDNRADLLNQINIKSLIRPET
jgi:hypothetical protein